MHVQALKAVVLALALSAALPGAAAPLVVRVTAHPTARNLTRAAVQIESDAAKRAETVTVGAATELDLAAGLYTIALKQRGFWARPSTVYVTEKGATADVLVFRESTVYGRLMTESNALTARFQAVPGSTDHPIEGESACTIDGRKWTCPVPAVRLDVSLKAPAHIAQHRWNVDAARGPADLGTLELKRGASLIGYVALDDDAEAKLDDVVVELHPLGAPSESNPTITRVKTNARGFFHFDGIAPGAWRVRATRGPLVSAHEAVRVIGDTEATLRRPLLLLPPHDVTVSVTPPHDPIRRRWTMNVVREEEVHGTTTVERVVQLPESGRAVVERLPVGAYSLEIRNVSGSVYARREINVPADVDIAITLRATRLAGTLSLGGKPLIGSLNFTGESFSIDARTNDAGQFRVTLPSAELRRIPLVVVHSDDPRVQRTLRDVVLEDDDTNPDRRRLDIDFADSFLAGEIVDERGRAVSSAVVRIASEGGTQEVRARDDGTFDIHGLEPGAIRIRAAAPGNRTSDEVATTITAGASNPASVRLVVRNGITIEGMVRSATGVVPGAVVQAFPAGAADSGTHISFLDPTGPDGRYKVNLPAGVAEVDIIVSAPGFALRFFRYALAEGTKIDLPVRQESADLTVLVPQGANVRDLTITHGRATRSLQLVSSAPLFPVESDGKRSLRVRELEPGHYTICLRTRCRSMNAAPFSSATFDLAAEGN